MTCRKEELENTDEGGITMANELRCGLILQKILQEKSTLGMHQSLTISAQCGIVRHTVLLILQAHVIVLYAVLVKEKQSRFMQATMFKRENPEFPNMY